MPRVSGIYSRPTGIDAVANNTIDSGKYNSNVADVEADLNLPRPVVAGGTGATTPHDALVNLRAEEAQQVVTNYDTFPFISGSFCSNPGATSAPNGTGAFTGLCLSFNNSPPYVILEARDANAPAVKYIRSKIAGTWGAWTQESQADADARYVNTTGDTMTGPLIISVNTPQLTLNSTTVDVANVLGTFGGMGRWLIQMTTTDFNVWRYTDAGVAQDVPLTINRANARVALIGDPTAPLHAVTKNYADTAVGLRVAKAGDNMTGPLAIGTAGTLPAPTALSVAYGAGTVGMITKGLVDNTNHNAFANSSGVTVGTIFCTTTTTSYNTSSDGTLKEDLQPAGINASQIINDTDIYNFRWKGTSDSERAYGVIAQQAAPIYPGPFQHDEPSNRWFVDYSKYVPILIQEAKTLKTRIADLETKLAGAMSRLDVLDKFREKIEAL